MPVYNGYADPLEVVDRIDLPYEERLATLQQWQADLARRDASQTHRATLAGAIQALETGAEIQGDEPAGAPEAGGYGVQQKD